MGRGSLRVLRLHWCIVRGMVHRIHHRIHSWHVMLSVCWVSHHEGSTSWIPERRWSVRLIPVRSLAFVHWLTMHWSMHAIARVIPHRHLVTIITISMLLLLVFLVRLVLARLLALLLVLWVSRLFLFLSPSIPRLFPYRLAFLALFFCIFRFRARLSCFLFFLVFLFSFLLWLWL